MAGRALWTPLLCLLLCRQPPHSACGRTAGNVTSFTYLTELRLAGPAPEAGRPRTFSLFRPDRTIRGRRIPGLARNSACCGRVNHNTRVLGGQAAAPNAFPWMAALVYPGDHNPFCAGSLINDRYVMTAAHCVRNMRLSDVQVILGKHELRRDSGNDLRLALSEVKIHPMYMPMLFSHDFALLKLATPLDVPIGDNVIAPICLPARALYPAQPVVAAGWGITESGGPPDQLHQAELFSLPSAACGFFNLLAFSSTMVCAFGNALRGGIDTCTGDSGGPLTAAAPDRPDRRLLLGLTSWGIGCGSPLSPGVYAKVPAVLDWVVASTEDARYC